MANTRITRRSNTINPGDKFGMLVVVGPGEPLLSRGRSFPRYRCMCECGATVHRRQSQLTSAAQQSCGCAKKEILLATRIKHGGFGSVEYKTWLSMKQRPQHNYGERGISVCDRWLNDFKAFLADMGPRPSPNHSIDRINNDGNYEPSNCRWANRSEQARNRRTNRLIFWNGKEHTLQAIADATNVDRATIAARLNRGWTVERAILEPVHKHVRKAA